MSNNHSNGKGVISSLDWITIVIYLTLLVFGWVSVCGASYSYGDTDIFMIQRPFPWKFVAVTFWNLGSKAG